MDPKSTMPQCVVCAQPAEKLKCVKCKTLYCSVECQTVDWKERGHKKECKRLFKANMAAVAKGSAPRDEAPTPLPSQKLKAAPPVVDGPTRGRSDVARVMAAATTAPAPEPEHWYGSSRCPVCMEDWDVNKLPTLLICCCKHVCNPCAYTLLAAFSLCPLCRAPPARTDEEILAILRRNAESDNPVAMCQLGDCYKAGDLKLVPSHKKAARLYQRASDLGDVSAMIDLGYAFERGEGVKIDKKKAVKYYRMAADRGHAGSQCNLGNALFNGTGVAPDHAEAVRYYKLAADQGYTEAEARLGIMYENGEGVARDIKEAIRWCERAAAKGDELAKHRLSHA